MGCTACRMSVYMCVCVQVKYTGYRDRPLEERRRRFMEDLQEGHSVIVRHVS